MRWGIFRWDGNAGSFRYILDGNWRYIGGAFKTHQEALRAAWKYRRKNKLKMWEIKVDWVNAAA